MGSPKDLNNPGVYAEALVRAALDDNPMALAVWLSEDDNVVGNPFLKWYLYFAERLIDLAPQPETGFKPRLRRAAPIPKIGRNEPCPCGSGKKFKQCHLGQEEVVAWKMGSPTPTIHAMAVAHIIHKSSLETLDRVPRELASAVALTEMASVYHDSDRLEEALALLKRALEGDREDPHLLYDYWIARYAEWLVEADRIGEGESFLMDEYDAPRNVEPWQVAQKLAAFYIDQGDTANAETWVDTALEGGPENPFNHYLRGMLHHESEQWEQAVAAYEQASAFSGQFRDEERDYMGKLVREGLDKARNRQPLEEDEEEGGGGAGEAAGGSPS